MAKSRVRRRDRPPPSLMLTWRANEFKRSDKDAEARSKKTSINATRKKISECGPTVVRFMRSIGTNGVDPFRYRRSEDQDPFVQEVLQACVESRWANIVPVEASRGRYPIVGTFLNFIYRNDAAYYTYLYCGMFHHTFMRGSMEDFQNIPMLWLKLKDKALRLLQREIDGLGSRHASDETISIILSLGVHEPNPEALRLRGALRNYPTSPLAKFQLLEFVGYLRPEPSHFKALYHLVAQRGGIHNVKTFGIANTLALADNIAATANLSRPGFACLWPTCSIVDGGAYVPDVKATELSRIFGFRFVNMAGLQCLYIQPLLNIIPLIREVTVAVDYYTRTGGKRPQIGDLITFANSVHNRILALQHTNRTSDVATLKNDETCLPLARLDEEASSLAAQTLELLRLTTLIYSDLVIFPIGRASGVRFNFAKRIH